MARISELHYSDAYARNSGVSEFLEVALGATDDPADFTVSFYNADGTVGVEVALDDPRVTSSIDPENGEHIYVLSADNLPIKLTDPDGNGADNYEAYALTNTAESTVLDFYDIGGGTRNIEALDGLAVGVTSENLSVVTGPNSPTSTIQFNQPNPDVQVFEAVGPGDTGLACFVSGMMIDTEDGPHRIEDLQPGDRVLTIDDGPQPVRWVGTRTVSGMGCFAPIRFRKGALGAERDVLVSPQHRMLITGWQTELLFGDDEVLVPAKALLNDTNVRVCPMPRVTYVHILFDAHQLVQCHGVLSESYYPAEFGSDEWDSDQMKELLGLFPELGHSPYGEAVRRTETVHLGQLLQVSA